MTSINESTWDVIVAGAGGSGLAAAYSAAELGAKVLVLEKRPQPGGTTGIAVGSFTAAETRWQRQAGVNDQVAFHVEDAGKFAAPEIEAYNNAPLREYFLRESAATLEWLEKLGLVFVGPHPEPPNRVPRMHNVAPGARAYIVALQKALTKAGGAVVCNAAVKKLRIDDGRVTGVQATVHGEVRVYQARRGVVMAAGDYANNPQMIAKHNDPRFSEVEGINPHAAGDGHLLAQSAGAHLMNMHIAYGPELRFLPPRRPLLLSHPFVAKLLAGGIGQAVTGAVASRLPDWAMKKIIKRLVVTWQHPENALFDDGAVLLNREGARFVNETVWPDREIGVARQPGKIAYLLMDGRLVARYSQWPHFISTAPDIAYAYVKDYQRLRPDITRAGNDLDQTAGRAGLDAGTIENTIHQFNAYVKKHSLDEFGRTGDQHPLAGPTWVLLGPLKAYFTTTEGGAAINEQMQVLDEQGQPIAGLYAVGQNGLGGMVLWGHGLHIAWAMTSGRLAGRAVMGGGT